MSINAQPFNPTFKLIGNLQEDQILVYDVSENAFVNAAGNGSGGASTALDNVVNTGTGLQLAEITGSAIEMKSIIAGDNVTITDNGAALVFNASFEESIQSGTNIGVGNGIYANVDGATNQLQFKSIRVMGDLQLADDGQTITISYSGSGGNGSVDLSDYYTKTETLSEVESDAKYLRLDAHSLPTQDNMWDIGSASKRFNDIYAETLQGTAVLAENLTITGNEGDVLTYSGGRWIAGQVTSDGTTPTPNLSLDGNQLTIAGGNTITLPVYQDTDNFVRLDGDSLPTQNNTFDIGSAEFRFNDVYGETFQGTAVLADNLTIGGGEGDVLTRIGNAWVARPASQAQIDLSDYALKTELPADISDLTDTTGLLGGTSGDHYTDADNQNYLGRIEGSIIPNTDLGADLGSPDKRFAELYLSTGSLYLGQNKMSIDNANDFKIEHDGVLTNLIANHFHFGNDKKRLYSNENIGYKLSFTNDTRTTNYGFDLGSNHIADMLDVASDVPSNGHALLWNASREEWVPGTIDSGTAGPAGPAGADGADGAVGPAGPKGDTGDAGPAGTTDYNLLQNLPTIPADISQLTDTNGIIQSANTDAQALTLNGSILQISGGNSVDLAGISGSGTLSGLTDTTVANLQQYQSIQWNGTSWVNSYPSIQHLSDIDRLNNPSNGDTLKWDASNNQFEFAPAAIQYDQDLNTTDDVTFNDITSTGTIQASGTVIANAFEGKLYNTQGQVILDNTAGNEGFGGNIYSNGASSFSGTVDFTGATVQGLSLNVSEFTNDAGYITSAAVFSGSYNDLTDTPTIPSTLGDLSNVSNNTPADGQHLVFDGATNQWKPSHASAGGESGYSDADSRNALSNGIGLSYNSSTGTFALNATISNLLDVDASGIQNGQVLKWSGSEFVPGDDTVLQSTDQLAEGSTNLWYSDSRVDNVLNQKTTTDIAEGANLYFTSDRVNDILDTQIVAGTGINISTGANNVKTISATVSSLDFSNITNTPTTLAGYGITDNVQGPAGEIGPKGDTGDTGPAGADGAQGIQGPVGPKGDTGDTGADGDQGPQGIQGPQGLKGDTGDAGADSTVAGPQGPQGLKGDTGDTGPQGIQGPAGADSTVAGPQGPAGADGAQGPQGLKGDKGDTGAQGPAGADGADGADGTTDYNLLTNKPTIPSDINDLTDADGLLGGSGSETLFGLTDTTISGISNDQILSYDTSDGKWKNVSLNAHPDFFGASDFSTAFSAKTTNDLGDVDTTGITSGQFLMWDGTKFIAQTVNSSTTVDLTNESINELSDVDTTTNSPVNGDVLTWDSTANSWSPAAASGGGGGGSSAQYFKVNYATNGSLQSITNTTSDVSASILSSTGGDVEITFNTNFPPASILIYGYAYQSNEYVVQPFNKDITTRKIAGGGTQGSPTAFGNFSGTTMTLKLREADTGSSRSFGTTTHAWIMFSMA